jgi:hypothetical protein
MKLKINKTLIKGQEQKIKIRRIRFEFEIPTTNRIKLPF